MARLERKYRLTVGQPKVETLTTYEFTEQEVFGLPEIPAKSGDYRTVTLNAVEIVDLDLQARIDASTKGGNKGVITIPNMRSETREIVEKVNNYVILEAGFESDDELKTIFTGQVSEYTTQRKGQDLETTLICTEGYIPNNSVRVSKAFPAGTSADKVFKYIIDQYKKGGVPLGQYVASANLVERYEFLQLKTPDSITFETGYSLSGYLSDELTELCNSMGYTNYITNGRLFIHPKSYTKTVEQFEIYEEQAYSIRSSGKASNNSTSKDEVGVTVNLPLDGRLTVDKSVKILDGEYAGTYRIMKCSFNIGYKTGLFDTTLECKRVDT